MTADLLLIAAVLADLVLPIPKFFAIWAGEIVALLVLALIVHGIMRAIGTVTSTESPK